MFVNDDPLDAGRCEVEKSDTESREHDNDEIDLFSAVFPCCQEPVRVLSVLTFIPTFCTGETGTGDWLL